MYTIIPSKKKEIVKQYDYIFKNYKAFYELAQGITYTLTGRYNIAIQTDDINETIQFMQNEASFDALIIDIYLPNSAVEYIRARYPGARIAESFSDYTVFMELVQKKSVYFDKYVATLLYKSIQHDVASMEEALEKIVQEYGNKQMITRKMLESLFIINDYVYPREVLLAYIQMDRYREVKLRKCLTQFDKSLVLNAMIKNVKQLVKDKAAYFKTGQASSQVKGVNTTNLLLMYRCLVAERGSFNDIEIILKLYERGDTIYGIV